MQKMNFKVLRVFRLWILLAAVSGWTAVSCLDLSETVAVLNLGEVKSRISRQFQHLERHTGDNEDAKSGGSGGGDINETNIAMSLVDALQKWADALEAQISMMREDMSDLKSSNMDLKDKVSTLEMDNNRLTSEVGQLTNRLDELTGKMNVVNDGMGVVEGLRDDILVMSTSFGEFLNHFNNYSIAVMSNYSSMTDELSTTVTTVRSLYSTITSMSTETQISSKNLSQSLSKLSTHMSEMDSGISLYKNFTLSRLEAIEKEVDSMSEVMVNQTTLEKIVIHFSTEITEVKTASTNNFSAVSGEVKDMATAFHQTLYNASFLIFHDVEEVKKKMDRVTSDLKKVSLSFNSDLKTVSAGLDLMAGGFEDKWKNSENKILSFSSKIDDYFSNLKLVELKMRDMDLTFPTTIRQLNVSLSASIGSLRFNVTHLDQAMDGLRSGLFKIESQMMANEMTGAANGNATLALQTRMRKIEQTVGDVQGKMVEVKSNLQNLASGHTDLAQNTTFLRGSLLNLESGLFELGKLTKRGETNSTMLQLGYRGLEKHYIELKRDLFETQLQVVSLNVSLNSVGEIRNDLVSVGLAMANTTSFLTQRIEEVSANCGDLKDDLAQAWNRSHFVDDKLHRFIQTYNHSSGNMFNTMTSMVEELNSNRNRTIHLELGLAGIMNFSLELESTMKLVQDNVSGCVQAIGGLNLNATHMSVRIDKLTKAQAQQGQVVLEQSQHFEGNVSQLSLAANILETELSRVASAYGSLKQALSSQIQSVGIMEVGLQKMTKETLNLKGEVDSLKFEVTSVKSETSGVTVFVTSMQNHLVDLTSNVTVVAQNVTVAMNEIGGMKEHLTNVNEDIEAINGNISQAINSLGSNGAQFESMKANMSNMKTNLVGLGNYINNINGDLSQLLVSFDGYAKKMSTELTGIKGNISLVSKEMMGTKSVGDDVKKKLESVEFMSTSVRNDVTSLTTKIYNIKTSLFEQTNEMSSLKATQTQMQTAFDKMSAKVTESSEAEKMMSQHVQEMQTEVVEIKTGLTSLTSTVLSIQSHVELAGNFDSAVVQIMSNISAVKSELTFVNKDISTLKPEVMSLSTDVGSFRESMNRMSKRSFDPDRFSCAVTSDEIRTPGVITYSTCNVNTDEILNPTTGHVTVRTAGDYFISFTANMVSVKSQAIWCALYKQSPGKDGWEVLGMINNFQRDAGLEDDRDSGSLSLITTLEQGDQVWVEWRGYGESFLYSNPYRLISFTGFLLNKNS